MNDTNAPVRPANRLARETSPYLLQHAHNPVDWHPWGDEAFALAAAEGKPIFLSIGYSTCHWCHVMERECFEDEAIARLLNRGFIAIKVDREERPDVDKIYMSFVQATTGSGGWPLNVFLTPDLRPFYGGTYFPPTPRNHLPAFPQLLERVTELWKEKRGELEASAADLTERIKSYAVRESGRDFPAGERELHGAGETYLGEFDHEHGGFGGAPKFPRPSLPLFLLRHWRRFHDAHALAAVVRTGEAMAAGGIHDQLGGGFSRYSVDAQWLVPHFEKMLYDQAQLTQLYLEAHLASGKPGAAAAARDICDYVLRDLTHPDGAFYSAEDADSEGQEGRFYCWTSAEMRAALGADEFKVAAHYFGVTDEGNFEDHSHPHPIRGLNVLRVARPDVSPADAPRLASARQKLLAVRAGRPRPHLDDKTIAAWNGMMLGALARAGVTLAEPRYLKAARRNFDFLRERLWDADRRALASVWRVGRPQWVALLDAYANTLAGVVDFYEATLDPTALAWAVSLAEAMVDRFADRNEGGFWQTAADAQRLLFRSKEDYDGAEPSGNSVACGALLRLSAIAGRPEWRELAQKSIGFFAQRLHQTPQAAPHLMIALDFAFQEPKRVVLAGDWKSPATAALLAAAHSVFEPHRVLSGVDGVVDPFAKTLPTSAEFTQAYCCSGSACQPPTRDVEKVRAFLAAK